MAGILVSMSVAMSWSGFVALVHDHRELQGSFAVSLRTPKAPLRVVRAERHLVGLEEHRADDERELKAKAFVAFRPGAASLNPEAAKLPKAFAFNSLSFYTPPRLHGWPF